MSMESFCHRLLGALFNGGYQGLLLTMVIWAGLKMIPRTNAATRHAVWFVTLLVVAALPVVHFFLPGSGEKPVRDPETSTAGNFSSAPADTVELWDHRLMVSGNNIQLDFERHDPSISPAGEAAGNQLTTEGIEDVTSLGGAQVSEAAPAEKNTGQIPSILSGTWLIPQGARLLLPQGAGVVLVGLWVVFAVLQLGNLAWQCRLMDGLKRRSILAPERLQMIFSRLGAGMKLKRKTRLMISPEPVAPMVVGFRRPVVLLPARGFEEVADLQLQHVLRHELAHVVRGDDWANLAQQVIKAVFFFHPTIWWLSRHLTLEREIACDDHVLAVTRTPRAYALFLTEFAGRMQCRDVVTAPAAWSNKKQLKERITMILDGKRNSSPRAVGTKVGILTTFTALAALLVMSTGPRLALAAEKPVDVQSADVAVSQETAETIEVSPVVEPVVVSAVYPVPSVQSAVSIPPIPVSPNVNVQISTVRSVPAPHPMPNVSIEPPAFVLASPVAPSLAGVAMTPAAPKPPSPRVSFFASAQSGQTSAESATSASSARFKRDGKGPGNDSMESRMDRLERMVEELLARDRGPRDARKDFGLKGGELEKQQEKFAKMADDLGRIAEKAAKAGLNEAEVARIRDQAKRDAERAVREAERAVREVEHAHAEAASAGQKEKEKGKVQVTQERNQFDVQRKVLESQRKALEKQLEAIGKQLGQLEETQHRDKERSEKDEQEKRSNQNRNSGSSKSKSLPDDENGPKKKTVEQ